MVLNIQLCAHHASLGSATKNFFLDALEIVRLAMSVLTQPSRSSAPHDSSMHIDNILAGPYFN